MTDDTPAPAPSKTPWHLWAVGIIAVLFNGIGAFDHIMVMIQGAAYLRSAGMSEAAIAHQTSLPGWMMAVWAIGVWGAMLGSILILLRRKTAWQVLAISLAAFLVSVFYNYGLTDGGAIMGQQIVIISVVIAGLLAFFTWYAWTMGKRGVLL